MSSSDMSAVKRLIVAPHCDDETLGCGGLIAKYQDECAVVVLAQPDEVRMKEFFVAKERLGYKHHEFLGLADGYLDIDMHQLVGLLDQVVAKYRPLEMYVPFPSMHQDHIAAYEAGIRAGRLSMSEGHWFTPSIFVYDISAYDINLHPTDLKWNVFESLTEAQIDRKVEALEAYASQAVTGPHPVNAIKTAAQSCGHTRAVGWAEQFALIRKVRA